MATSKNPGLSDQEAPKSGAPKATPPDQPLSVPCNAMGVNLLNAGKFITEPQAKASLNAYFQEPGVPPRTDKSHIFGHTFGLNTLKRLFADIESYNLDQENEKDMIKGIRVYYGKCVRNDPDFPVLPKDQKYRDVFFMPVLANGDDIYKVNKLLGKNMIVGGSRPCPNECKQTFC